MGLGECLAGGLLDWKRDNILNKTEKRISERSAKTDMMKLERKERSSFWFTSL